MDRFLSGLTYRQFREWELWSELEPWGPMVDDYHHSLIAAMVVNSAGRVLPDGKRVEPRDYMVCDLGQRQQNTHTAGQMKSLLTAAMWGGKRAGRRNPSQR